MFDSPLKPVIFLAFANDRSAGSGYLRHLPEEARLLEQILNEAKQAGLCEVVLRYNSTAEDVIRVFQSHEYRDRIAIFHYGGHANSYQLLLESRSGEVLPANASSIASLLGLQTGLQLVFLNGCSTEQHACGLLEAGVPVVIATSQIIADEVAVKFAQGFYGGLAGGASIDSSYQQAIVAVELSHGSAPRGLVPNQEEARISESLPWHLHIREGAEQAARWSLADAAGKPLFGLPALPAIDLPESPFRQLNRFQREHAGVFFGRGYEIRDLYHRIGNRQSAPILLVYGQSGVGKSSLLAAGLLPRLETGNVVHYRRRERGVDLWSTLLAALSNDAEQQEMDSWRKAEMQAGRPVIVIFDQLEEVFTRPDSAMPEEWPAFLAGLQSLFGRSSERPQGKLILSFRKEWLPEIESALSKQALPRNRVYIEPLNDKGIIEAIEGPASTSLLQQCYGLTVAEGLAKTIADDLLSDRDSPVAPVLQILLSKLWEQARAESFTHPYFTRERYQHLKRDGLLLGDFLDQELALIEKTLPDAVHSGLLHDLLAFFTTPQGTAEERSLTELKVQYGMQNENVDGLIKQCQDHYLLVDSAKEQSDGRPSLRLCHDALAPLIRVRFDESDRPGQRARRILENRAVDWRNHQAGNLLDEADLAMVETGETGIRQWKIDEQRLIDASRQARILRARRKKRFQALGLAALLTILGTAIFATWQWRVAEQRSEEAQASQQREEREKKYAQSRQQAAQANIKLTVVPNDLVLGSLLAMEALNKAQTVEAYRAWSTAMTLLPRQTASLTVKPEEKITAFAFSPDGQYLAATVNEGSVPLIKEADKQEVNATQKKSGGSVRIWDTATGQQKRQVGAGPRWLSALAYSPDGSQLAAGGADGIITVWDTQTGGERLKLQHDASVNALAFQEQGHRLLSTTRDESDYSMGHWWNVDSGQEISSLPLGEPGGVTDVETSADGLLAVTSGKDGFLKVWNTQTGQALHQIQVSRKGEERLFALADNGQRLAWADGDAGNLFSDVKSLIIWDIDSNQRRSRFEHANRITQFHFSPDGKHLAVCMGFAQEIWLWNSETNSLTSKYKFDSKRNICESIVFSPDSDLLIAGDRIATHNQPAIFSVWDTKNGKLLSKLEHSCQNQGGGFFTMFGFSTDNSQLYTALQNCDAPGLNTLFSWNARTGSLDERQNSEKARCIKGKINSLQYHTIKNKDDTFLQFCDKVSGQMTQKVKVKNEMIEYAAISRDGKKLAVTHYDCDVILFNLQKKSLKNTFQTNGWTYYLKFIDKTNSLLTKDSSGAATIWDINSGKRRFQLAHHRTIDISFLSPESARIATVNKALLQVWDVITRKSILSKRHLVEINNFALSANGRRLLEVGQDNISQQSENFVQVWDVENKKKLFSLNHDAAVNVAAFSSDATRIITGSNDHTARLWDAHTGRELARFQHDEAVDYVFITQDNHYLVTRTNKDNSHHVWDIATQKQLGQISSYGYEKDIKGLAYDPKHQQLATLRGDSVIQLWDMKNHGAELRALNYSFTPDDLQISPDGQRLLALDADTGEKEDTVRAHLLSDGRELFSLPPRKHIFAMKMAPDGATFVTEGNDSILRVWNAGNGQLLRELKHQNRPVQTIYSPDSLSIATYDKNPNDKEGGSIRIFNLATGQAKTLVNDAYVNSLSFSPDGRLLASAEGQEDLEKYEEYEDEDAIAEGRQLQPPPNLGITAVRIWDVSKGREVFRLAHNNVSENIPKAAHFSPDGKWIATTDLRTVQVWDTRTGKLLHNLDPKQVDEPYFYTLTEFSRNGHYIAAIGHQTIHLIDLQNDGSEKHLNYQDSIGGVIFSPDNQTLAVSHGDTISIWSIPEQHEIAQMQGASSLIFTPDSRHLITGHDDGKVRIWALKKSELIETACKRLERNLSLEEWRTYMGDNTYPKPPTCPNLPGIAPQQAGS